MNGRAAPSRRAVLEGIAAELDDAGVESARLEAERLVCHALGIARSELALDLDKPLEGREARELGRSVARRLAGEPLQHIEGETDFRDLTLRADRRALIPRPETEQLVELVARWAQTRNLRKAGAGVRLVTRPAESESRPTVHAALDVGTGSGAIALSLVQEGIAERALGLDASAAALEQARENRARVGLEDSVELRRVQESIWQTLAPAESFDVIVSNPPYIPGPEIPDLPREVGRHEPCLALDGGRDGLDVIREVIVGARARLRPGGALFLEVGEGQAAAVRALLLRHGPWRTVTIHRDLAARERFVAALI